MSKERAKNRAVREAAQAAERDKRRKAAERKARLEQVKAARPKVPEREPVYKMRRYPPLPWRLKLALVLGWLFGAAAILYLAPTWTGRLGLLVVLTMLVPLIVVLVRDPSRRTR